MQRRRDHQGCSKPFSREREREQYIYIYIYIHLYICDFWLKGVWKDHSNIRGSICNSNSLGNSDRSKSMPCMGV